MISQLPLFPLRNVLFPGVKINLHIFEDRYRQMIGRCINDRSPFGVILIQQGDEVLEGRSHADLPQIATIGTAAMINSHVRLDDGRFLITAIGTQRFQIETLQQQSPYLIAQVTELPEAQAGEVTHPIRELRTVYERYWQAVATATGSTLQAEELPDDPYHLTYQLADRLQVSLERKQRWLEHDVSTRIREITSDLRAELLLMPTGKRRGGDGLSGMNSLN
jgi:Lon protease-like protein